jgi:hypothetical protein
MSDTDNSLASLNAERLRIEEEEERRYKQAVEDKRLIYRAKQNLRLKQFLVIIAFLFIIGSALIIFRLTPFFPANTIVQDAFIILIGLIIILLLILGIGSALLFISILSQKEFDEVRRRMGRQREERDEREPLTRTNDDYFDNLVKINVDNLRDYYALVKVQTNNSFIASIGAGMVGFILIVIGLLMGFINGTNNVTAAYISIASGIITEFISAIFFYLYNQTVRQMKEYHDSLLEVQNILMSFKIIGQMTNEDTKIEALGVMLSSIWGAKSLRSLQQQIQEQTRKHRNVQEEEPSKG